MLNSVAQSDVEIWGALSITRLLQICRTLAETIIINTKKSRMDCEFLCHFQLPRIVSSHSAPPTSCTAKHLQNFYFQCLTAERAACSPSSSWALLCLCHLLCVRCHRSLLLLVHLSLLRQILSFCTCSLARKRKTERTAEEDTDISQKQRVDNWGRGGIQQRAGKGRQRDGGADRLPWPEVGQPLSLEAWYAGQYQTWYVGSVLGAWYARSVLDMV